jgi:hypothetical protein
VSFDLGAFRLKLQCVPQHGEFLVDGEPRATDFVAFKLNFHADVRGPNPAECVIARLMDWDTVATKAAEFAALI